MIEFLRHSERSYGDFSKILAEVDGEEQNRMKKRASLNRFLSVFTGIICLIIVFFLLIIDIFLITGYQKAIRTSEESVLAEYVGRCSEDFSEISNYIDDIYANDNGFAKLAGTLRPEEVYDIVYDLDFELKSKLRVEETLAGYILLYGNLDNARYYTNTGAISYDDMRELKTVVSSFFSSENGDGQWTFVEINGNVYGIWLRIRGNASIAAFYSLQWLKEQIPETVKSADDIMFVWDGQIFGQEDTDKYDDLPSITENYAQVFRVLDGNCYIYGNRVENSDLWVCMSVPVTLFTYMGIPQLLMIVLTACSLIFVFMIYRYLRKGVIFPLKEVIHVMNQIRDGMWDARMEGENSFEELEQVNETLEVMVSEIKKQKLLSYEQTIEKQKAQLQYLQLQLKPHFYLNGLKTLNVLFRNGDATQGEKLILRLSEHLRYLLQSERELVPLNGEIDYVKNYVQLQKDMTGRPFSVEWEAEQKRQSWMVPTLCIQTFVENSFKYARLGSADMELLIRIHINELDTEEGLYLDIRIHDNGSGYPEEVLDEINQEPEEGSTMVGINNIKRRCRLIYEDQAEFFFYNDRGAQSEMILPFVSQEKVKK